MADEKTVTMSVTMLERLIKLNRDAYSAVSLVGGNSVQDSYKHSTQKELDSQLELLKVFEPDNNSG